MSEMKWGQVLGKYQNKKLAETRKETVNLPNLVFIEEKDGIYVVRVKTKREARETFN